MIYLLLVFYILTVPGMYGIQRARDDDKPRCFYLALSWPIWLPAMGLIWLVTMGEVGQ